MCVWGEEGNIKHILTAAYMYSMYVHAVLINTNNGCPKAGMYMYLSSSLILTNEIDGSYPLQKVKVCYHNRDCRILHNE